MGVRVPTSLLYADDILIFCMATRGNVLLLEDIFRVYGAASGQLVSPSKSRVFYGKYMTMNIKHLIHSRLHFVQGSLSLNYLGVPIFGGKPTASVLRPTVDKILAKLNRWSGSMLSMAGRACLVKSVISSSLTHSMMVYRWPRSLLKIVDVAMRNFVWNGDIAKTSHGSVAWVRVCSSQAEGGLGIHSPRAMNESFLYKLTWEII
ncbi:hypothetical protein ACS0TY_022218 [Phlomoides rotata]